MISPATLRQWFPTTVEELSAELERRLELRREHRRLERQIHGRVK